MDIQKIQLSFKFFALLVIFSCMGMHCSDDDSENWMGIYFAVAATGQGVDSSAFIFKVTLPNGETRECTYDKFSHGWCVGYQMFCLSTWDMNEMVGGKLCITVCYKGPDSLFETALDTMTVSPINAYCNLYKGYIINCDSLPLIHQDSLPLSERYCKKKWMRTNQWEDTLTLDVGIEPSPPSLLHKHSLP